MSALHDPNERLNGLGRPWMPRPQALHPNCFHYWTENSAYVLSTWSNLTMIHVFFFFWFFLQPLPDKIKNLVMLKLSHEPSHSCSLSNLEWCLAHRPISPWHVSFCLSVFGSWLNRSIGFVCVGVKATAADIKKGLKQAFAEPWPERLRYEVGEP